MATIMCNTDQIKRAIEYAGTILKLAIMIKCEPTLISKWKNGKLNPSPINCLRIEKATKGLVRAKDILPDYDWENVI